MNFFLQNFQDFFSKFYWFCTVEDILGLVRDSGGAHDEINHSGEGGGGAHGHPNKDSMGAKASIGYSISMD